MLYEKSLKTKFRSCTSITEDVCKIISDSGVQEGFCVVSVPHTTAGLGITSFWDPRGLVDLMDEIDRNFPVRVNYLHQDSPYDAGGHVKSALMGTSAFLLIHEGKMVLGSSQGLVFVEFDGPRLRKIRVEVISKNLYLRKSNIQTQYMGMHDITAEVRNVVEESNVKNGICHISILHSTAGLILTPVDIRGSQDVMSDIERMVPTRADFKHRETASDAGGHVKTALTDSQLTIPVVDGGLAIDDSQAITFAEYDGPRPRSFYVAVLSD